MRMIRSGVKPVPSVHCVCAGPPSPWQITKQHSTTIEGHRYSSGCWRANCACSTLSASDCVYGSAQSPLMFMLMRPPGTSRRNSATAAACARSTLCDATNGSVPESPSAAIDLLDA